MLVESSMTKVKFCDLIEHPGGHDGGEFPQYETFEDLGNGSVVYHTGQPVCPTDSFCDEDDDQFVYVETREEAVARLRGELDNAREHVKNLETILNGFELAKEFSITFDGEPYDQNNDEDEEDPD